LPPCLLESETIRHIAVSVLFCESISVRTELWRISGWHFDINNLDAVKFQTYHECFLDFKKVSKTLKIILDYHELCFFHVSFVKI